MGRGRWPSGARTAQRDEGPTQPPATAIAARSARRSAGAPLRILRPARRPPPRWPARIRAHLRGRSTPMPTTSRSWPATATVTAGSARRPAARSVPVASPTSVAAVPRPAPRPVRRHRRSQRRRTDHRRPARGRRGHPTTLSRPRCADRGQSRRVRSERPTADGDAEPRHGCQRTLAHSNPPALPS